MSLQELMREYVILTNRISENEIAKREAQDALKDDYARLVVVCPHAEVIDHKMDIRGWGVWRVCKTCGLEDHAIIGATSGDEYNYGYAGHIDRNFWAGSEASVAKNQKEFDSYRRGHYWRVIDGKVVNKI